jgi:hypothetical protein
MRQRKVFSYIKAHKYWAIDYNDVLMEEAVPSPRYHLDITYL